MTVCALLHAQNGYGSPTGLLSCDLQAIAIEGNRPRHCQGVERPKVGDLDKTSMVLKAAWKVWGKAGYRLPNRS